LSAPVRSHRLTFHSPLRRGRRAALEGDLACRPAAPVGVLIVDDAPQKPSIADLVIAGLANGLLWMLDAEPVWSGFGTLKPCVVCRLRIPAHDIQYDVPGPRGTLPAHVSCYRVWRAQSDSMRKAPEA
jgi:hypothetical protein